MSMKIAERNAEKHEQEEETDTEQELIEAPGKEILFAFLPVNQFSGPEAPPKKVEPTDKEKKHLAWRTRIFFSVGHVYNDLCASIWFSYTLLFFQLHFNGHVAGILLLLGQVADALVTPLIGLASDYGSANARSWVSRYGPRKTWHLLGTILISASFPFIFNSCIGCEKSDEWIQCTYYAIFITLFQFGWAAVQVAHVALITDLTPNSDERVELNAYRQAATVASSVCLYSVTLLVLGVEGHETIKKEDAVVFTNVVYIVCGIGIFFSALFHIFLEEPKTPLTTEPDAADEPLQHRVLRERALSGCAVTLPNFNDRNRKMSMILHDRRMSVVAAIRDPSSSTNKFRRQSHATNARASLPSSIPSAPIATIDEFEDVEKKVWSDWFRETPFYLVGFIYMMTRLYVNLTQVYTPLYLQDTLQMPKRSVAIIPFVTYVTGFLFSLTARPISSRIGSKFVLAIGCGFGVISCMWMFFGVPAPSSFTTVQIYGVAAVFGIGGTAMLIASLAITADLIGDNTTSGAFVFGAMSFLDKMINGAVVILVQHFNPDGGHKVEETETEAQLYPGSVPYYQYIMVFVAGSAAFLAFFGLLMMVITSTKSNDISNRDSQKSNQHVNEYELTEKSNIRA